MASINLAGSIGVPGGVAVLGNYSVVFASDADHTMSATEYSNKFLEVTSSVTLTATRKLIAPLNQGQEFVVQNKTSGELDIQIIGATGTGVIVPANSTLLVVCDGTNYLQSVAGGAVGGDLTGSLPNPTVSGIDGFPINTSPSVAGQILIFNGTQWAVSNLPRVYSSAHTVLVTDGIILADLSTTAWTLTLTASPYTGEVHTIKDYKGNAATNNLTIGGNGKNIEQFYGAGTAANLVLNQNWDSVTLVYNGTTWSII